MSIGHPRSWLRRRTFCSSASPSDRPPKRTIRTWIASIRAAKYDLSSISFSSESTGPPPLLMRLRTIAAIRSRFCRWSRSSAGREEEGGVTVMSAPMNLPAAAGADPLRKVHHERPVRRFLIWARRYLALPPVAISSSNVSASLVAIPRAAASGSPTACSGLSNPSARARSSSIRTTAPVSSVNTNIGRSGLTSADGSPITAPFDHKVPSSRPRTNSPTAMAA